ncbi:TRAP transporter large permease [Pandoraea sputorum]|uniref:ABC transporter permease n=1 Tax=Pandoraea sputorum TaxID=93222 RepID=A0A239SQ49_9BURK|nr:TRAP transporter large permease subunit [Pandoraea sputorum]AJC18169.2 ABC transporter permease [Pandoraea sputorum]SNU87537.1 Neu5Ac permease [Pandoraea sputorum]VVE50331.1 ABC transporter permease [Pandoraea sputorum]VVE78257.1 ABC transporter permease [Pandoraea sputorum]VVE85534.1 ABC transporter permease [Pandoraea sputorum]
MTAEPTHALARLFCHVNRAVMKVTEAVAVLLVVAETLILLAGVVSRYGFDNPLTWSDELAQMLFIWLSMLGAVLALDRGEHMRLSAIVNKLPAAWRDWFQTMAALTVCVFVALIIMPAYTHAIEQMDITTPALEIPDGLRAAALPVGAALMLIAAISRMARCSSARQFGLGVLFVAALGAALWLGRPALIAMGNYNLLIFFVLIVGACVAGGIPIAFAFGTATLAYLALVTDAPLQIVVSRMDEGMSGLVLLSVPLFVLLGALIEMSGLARSLIEFMASLLGHVRGGLQYVLLGAMFLVSGISGSKAADMAAVAPALFPEMQRRGSKQEDLVALLSATGAMTETIPPSLVLITIGAVCGVSITALFVGGLLPAVIATLAIVVVCFARSRKEAPSAARRAPWGVIGKTFIVALPALALPILIRTAVIEGAATATEVSTIGIAYTIVIGLIVHAFKKHLNFKRLYPLLTETAALSGAILLIIGMATAMAWALTQSGFSAKLVGLMHGVPGGQVGFLLISMVVFIVLGSVLEGIPAIVLFGPLLFPVARSLGIHDVHYAMVVILSMGMGLFAPPLGVGFYAACAIGKTSPDKVFNRMWTYMGALLVALLIVVFIPWISIGFLK